MGIDSENRNSLRWIQLPPNGCPDLDLSVKIVSSKDRHDREINIFLVSDNGLDFDDPIPLETVSAELILPTEEDSEG